MAEAFHNWVNSLSWWERFWYELVDPNVVHCSTYTPIAPIWFVVFLVIVLGFFWYFRREFKKEKKVVG